jgi:hypothetical protein
MRYRHTVIDPHLLNWWVTNDLGFLSELYVYVFALGFQYHIHVWLPHGFVNDSLIQYGIPTLSQYM